ncbi:hypothetical protein [Pararhodospirillum oryzae]|uniref:Uncharacterized protein n=1 Tax=Pararhodospirillum oryzae TaxID=478448 RepID=A0A512H498_9PROT|nr:hypothetical protein [Pararhodospirillum oryzae]GEO80267.1 hypothetical protein ROR02_03980 [Pararhodospirillum oryzae]
MTDDTPQKHECPILKPPREGLPKEKTAKKRGGKNRPQEKTEIEKLSKERIPPAKHNGPGSVSSIIN